MRIRKLLTWFLLNVVLFSGVFPSAPEVTIAHASESSQQDSRELQRTCIESDDLHRVTVDNSIDGGATEGCLIDSTGWPKVIVRVYNEHGFWTNVSVFDNFGQVQIEPRNVWAYLEAIAPDSYAEYALTFDGNFYSRVMFFVNAGGTENGPQLNIASGLNLLSKILPVLNIKLESANLEDLRYALKELETTYHLILAADALSQAEFLRFSDEFSEAMIDDKELAVISRIALRFGVTASISTLKNLFTLYKIAKAVKEIWEISWAIAADSYAGTVTFEGQNNQGHQTPVPPTPLPLATPTNVPQYNDALFIRDITLPDGTIVSPGQSLTKTWRVKNTGSSVWSTGYQLAFRSGYQLGAPNAVNIPAASPGQEVDISVPLQIPANLAPGDYKGIWQLRNPSGTYFGPLIWYLLRIPGAQPSTGNSSGVELVSINSPSSLSPGQSFLPEVTVRLTSGQLRQDRGDMLRHYIGTNYSDFQHVAVQGTINSGETYTFRFYSDHPMIAPSSRGNYESVWRVWANGGWVGPEIPIRFSVYDGGDSHPPNAPTPTNPNDWAVLVGQMPSLCAQQNGDPDGDAVTEYRFVIYDSAQGYDSGWVSSNCVTPQGLGNYTYKWHVKVRDSRGTESGWSTDRRFTIESSTVTVTKLDFNPVSPSNSEFVFISVDSSGCGGVNVGGKVLVNTATDGSANGEWRKIKDIGPKTTPQDEPRWETIEYQEGLHRVRVEMTSCDGTISTRDTTYQVNRGKPSRPFLQAPANNFWSDSRTITFRWQPAMRANDYTLLISTTDPAEAGMVRNVTLSGTEYTTTFDQDYLKLYWWVKANNEFGSSQENGRWFGIDRTPPSSAIDTNQTPVLSYESQVNVVWNGNDNASGIQTYDVMVWTDEGEWTEWLAGYPYQSALFTGQPGRGYCFRTRARDIAGNVEAYPDVVDHCVGINPALRPPQAWWDRNYLYKRNIVIANRMSNVALETGYPVHLHFDSSTTPTAAEIYAASIAANKGDDLRIVYNDQTQLARYILNFSNSVIDLWFAIQEGIGVNGSSSRYALYYSNGSPDSPPSTFTEVFAPHMEGQTKALWYFEEPDGNAPDLSGNNNTIFWANGTPTHSLGNGKHGGGISLDGSQWGTVQSIASDQLTVEGWVWFDSLTNHSLPAYDWTGMMASYDSRDNHNRWRVTLTGNNGSSSELRADMEIVDSNGQSNETTVTGNVRIEANRWYHVALTFDGSTIRLWLDGQVVGSTSRTGRVDNRMTTIYVGRNRLDHPPMVGRLDGWRISSVARSSFPYGIVMVEPSVGANQQVGQEVIGQSDIAIQNLRTFPNPNGGVLVQATLQNQGNFPTYNEFFVHLYKDHIPTGPGDLLNATGFWVNAPIAPGAVVTLTSILTQAATINAAAIGTISEQNFSLSAQADSLGVVNERDKSNNVVSDVPVCVASADAYEDDDSSIQLRYHTAGETKTHNFDRPGDEDWFIFYAEGAKTYHLQTQNLGAFADTILTLYAPDRITVLGSNDDISDTLASGLIWTAPKVGYYLGQVRNWNPSIGGCGTSYDMSITKVVSETPTPTNTPLPTTTPLSTPTLVSDPTPTSTDTPLPTITPTTVNSPTFTPTVVNTQTPTPTETPTGIPASTATPEQDGVTQRVFLPLLER